jgi:hypothetical protein
MSYIDPVILAELAELDGKDIKPTEGGKRPSTDSLAEGLYDFEVQSGEFKKTSSGSVIFSFVIKVIGGANDGYVCETPAKFLKGQDGTWDERNIASLKGDLITLGFDADAWTGSRTFTSEIAKVMPKLKGIKAKGQRKNGTKGTKVYYNFYINAMLPRDYKPQAPMKFSFENTEAVAAANKGEIPW